MDFNFFLKKIKKLSNIAGIYLGALSQRARWACRSINLVERVNFNPTAEPCKYCVILLVVQPVNVVHQCIMEN